MGKIGSLPTGVYAADDLTTDANRMQGERDGDDV